MNPCPQCFSDIPDGQNLCPSCGFMVESESSAWAEPSETGQGEPEELLHFRRQFEERSLYLPTQLLERAEAALSNAEVELRQATVLIADVCGFSRATREKGTEALSVWINQFYKICSDCILRRGGFVVKFIGDAVLAVFGAPVAFDRDVESAVQAALDIRDYASHARGEGEAYAVSIGLATGELRSGLIDSPSGKVFDILGDTVNVAARLQSAAGQNEVFICQETWHRVERWVKAEETEPLALKNIDAAYVARRVLAFLEKPAPRREFSAPFLGREKEKAKTLDFLRSPLRQQGGVLEIQGEAGLGKTRLLREALDEENIEGRSVIWWQGSPGYRGILLWPILEWIREKAGIAGDDAPETVQLKLQGLLESLLPGEERDGLLLEYLFGLPEALEAMRGLPVERVQRNLFGIIREMLFASIADDVPLRLVLDDAHWMDSLTVQWVNQILDWPSRRPFQVILTRRSGEKVMLSGGGEPERLHLAPLPEGVRRQLLERLAPMEEFLPEIRDLIFSRAAGNPLFIEEMTRMVRHHLENLRGQNGTLQKNRIVEVIPVSLQELVQSRIDRLDAHSRQVLQCASLIGLEFTVSMIELFDAIREGLEDQLQALRGSQYIRRRADIEDLYYYFTHGIYRDAAYSTLLEEQKQNLHNQLALRFEKAFADRLPEYYELLAYHYHRAANMQKALFYQVKAADRQAALGSAQSAAEMYHEVMEWIGEQPSTLPRQVLMARVLIRAARLERALGHALEADDLLVAACSCSREAENGLLLLEAETELAVGRLWRGETEGFPEELEALEKRADHMGSAPLRCILLNTLGVYFWRKGELEKALKGFQDLARVAGEGEIWQVQADAFNNAGLIYWRWGEYSQAVKAFRRALPLRRKVSDQYGLSATLQNLGIVQEQLGETKVAAQSYQNAERLAEKIGFVQALAAIKINQSNLHRRQDRYQPALEQAQQALELARQYEDPRMEALALLNSGLARMELGQHTEARAEMEESHQIAQSIQQEELATEVALNRLELDLREERKGHDLLQEINHHLDIVESRDYGELKPLAFRLKGMVLRQINTQNGHTAREYLETALELARQMRNWHEEKVTKINIVKTK